MPGAGLSWESALRMWRHPPWLGFDCACPESFSLIVERFDSLKNSKKINYQGFNFLWAISPLQHAQERNGL